MLPSATQHGEARDMAQLLGAAVVLLFSHSQFGIPRALLLLLTDEPALLLLNRAHHGQNPHGLGAVLGPLRTELHFLGYRRCVSK